MKHRNKLISILLCACIFFGIFAACAEEKQPEVPTSDGHEKLAQVFTENAAALEMLQTVDSFLDGIAEPTVQVYTEALVTAMVTYDMHNALQVAEQYQTENLKLAQQNNLDFDAIETATTATMMNMDDSTAVFQEKLAFLPGKTSFENYSLEWIYAVSEIETIMQNYSIYHTFLKTIADNTTSSLQEAAKNVQNSMQSIAEQRGFFGDTATGFGGVSAFFFDSYFFSHASIDKQYQILVDTVLSTLASTAPTEATPIPGEEAWKKAYFDWIHAQNFAYEHCEFALIHLNNDGIPELYQSYSEYDSALCSYDNGTFLLQDGLEIVSYIEGENYFLASGGRMDYYHDKVYSLEGGTFILHHTGRFGYIDTLYANEERIYDYYWDGEKVSKDEYQDLLHAAFDESRETRLLYRGVSYAEIVAAIILYEVNR